jgi:hypothetical protein
VPDVDACSQDVILLQEVWCPADVKVLTRSGAKCGMLYHQFYHSGFLGGELLTLSKHPIIEVLLSLQQNAWPTRHPLPWTTLSVAAKPTGCERRSAAKQQAGSESGNSLLPRRPSLRSSTRPATQRPQRTATTTPPRAWAGRCSRRRWGWSTCSTRTRTPTTGTRTGLVACPAACPPTSMRHSAPASSCSSQPSLASCPDR